MRQLLDLALPKVKKLMAEGVTRIEIKSGYGLDLDTETKILKVAKAIEKALPISVSTTFLGAHVFPIEYQGREDEYLFTMCQQWIPQLAQAQLIDAVDVFCEPSAFGLSMAKTLFDVAKHHQLKVKMHAEQLSNQHGAALAASYQALSADHLNYLDEPGVKALANNNTVAVLLPLTHYYLQANQFPPVSLLRDNHVDIAIASDYNAGSSPMLSLLLAANMACIRFGLSAEEALKGITLNAAKALNVQDDEGALVVGKVANMIVWNITAPRDICVQFGLPQIYQRIYKGKITQA
jgi:imidazolonepropionase